MLYAKNRWLLILLFIFVIILIILASSYALNNYYQNFSESLSSKLNSLQNSIDNKNWGNAAFHFDKIKSEWDQNKNTWAMLIDHQEIDNIEISVVRLEKYIKSASFSEALSESSVLMMYIKHIPNKEVGNLVNIL